MTRVEPSPPDYDQLIGPGIPYPATGFGRDTLAVWCIVTAGIVRMP